MPNWAKNTWPTVAFPNGDDLNDLANSIRTWGYSLTPGAVTINANQNNLANAGVVTAVTLKAMGTLWTEGSVPQQVLKETGVAANYGIWKWLVDGGVYSLNLTSDDETSNVSVLQFFRNATTPQQIKMYLGGSLKTLSVDGSGFVKAT